MLRKIFFSLVIAIVTLGSAMAQDATIKGKVLDDEGKPLEFASVRLMNEGELIRGTTTDRRGEYSLTPVPAGTYTLIVSFSGFAPYTINGVKVLSNEIKIMGDINMILESLTPVIIIDKPPMITMGKEGNDVVYDSKELRDLPTRGIDAAVSGVGGVTRGAGGLTVRANRADPVYYVDGVPTGSIPNAAIGSVAVISGSIPPEYGDAAAVIEIETKGPTSKLRGGVDIYTYVDGHDIWTVEANTTGPIVKPKNNDGKSFSMGYMIGFTAQYVKSPILWKGHYRASQETIDYLKANPFRSTEDLSSSVVSRNVDYVTKYQEGNILSLEENRARQMQNAWTTSINVRPKIDIRTPVNMDFSIGGRFSYSTGRDGSFGNSLFNFENNSLSESMGYEINARFTHRLDFNKKPTEDGKENKSIIRNAYYRLIGYYIHGSGHTYNHIHKDNLFNYGYVGTFDHVKVPLYEWGTVIDPADSSEWYVQKLSAWQNIAVNFTPSDLNPDLAQYTLSAEERYGGTFPMDEWIQEYMGLLNGRTPAAVYGMFSTAGVPYNGYSKSLSEKVGGKALVTFEIRDHAIRLGYEYDQTIGRSYGINPGGLWTRMRDLANSHISELDLDNPIFLEDEFGERTGYVNYDRYEDRSKISHFDSVLRKQLGAGDKEWIDIDSYKPSNFSLDMFSAEELFNSGSGFNGERGTSISYHGYNYLGNKVINRAITMADMKKWFDEGSPNFKRDLSEIGATKPVKMAAYIQDRFSVNTLYVMLGLRLDIFNVNQPCVKDMYLYRPANTVKEAQATGELSDAYIPPFMDNSDDFYIYVRDIKATQKDPVAFRSGEKWYDKNGLEVVDPDEIAREEGINQLMPWLQNPNTDGLITKVNWDAFKNYSPSFKNGGVTLSPRIAFSFAVGQNSQFSASYNVITTWSSAAQPINPISYLFFEKFANQSTPFSNPGLKPERSVNYEIGFKQLINTNMNMEFVAYYSERKDQVVVFQYSQAYPSTYISYTNMDFGTVQGFILGLNMRAHEKSRASFRANYTLQFAKGTGSDPGSTISLIRAGQPNLRTLTNLDDDQRHKINLQVVYAFRPDDAKINVVNKKTKVYKEYRWLSNVVASLDLGAGSGLPFTRSSVAFSSFLEGQGSRVVEGAINGSRMPWTIDGNLAIRKGFVVTLKKDKENSSKDKKGMLEVGLTVRNIIGYKNQRWVYTYTGSRMDDGFLTAKDFQQYINNQTNVAAFIDYYRIRMEGNNPYGAPRTFELQLSFLF